jgi:hypothetical protein
MSLATSTAHSPCSIFYRSSSWEQGTRCSAAGHLYEHGFSAVPQDTDKVSEKDAPKQATSVILCLPAAQPALQPLNQQLKVGFWQQKRMSSSRARSQASSAAAQGRVQASGLDIHSKPSLRICVSAKLISVSHLYELGI